MLDAGLVLYLGLLALVVWRFISGWRLCGARLEYTNYCVLLYLLLLTLLVYAVYLFIRAALHDSGKAWQECPHWLRPLVLGAPAAGFLSYLLSGVQTAQHVTEIRRGAATLRHDRAVQILALPVVYGTMAMSSLARMYQLTAGSFDDMSVGSLNAEQRKQLLKSKSETCFWVGDLYEAWALFQFGRLTLELIKSSMMNMRHSPSASEELREASQALLTAHSAVESIAWLGVTLFLVVCVLQAGWSLYLLTFTAPQADDWAEYNLRMSQFRAAGMLASAGAIYNVHVVESTFDAYLEGYRPLLKFLSVKIIVSFAFFQRGIYFSLKTFQQTLPSVVQGVVNKVGFLGDILNLSEVQFDLFYDSLILYECVLIALLHWWGWSAYEKWYLEDKEDGDEAERRPLLAGDGATPTQGGRV